MGRLSGRTDNFGLWACRGVSGPNPDKVCIQLVSVLDSARIDNLDVGSKSIELDAGLSEEGLISSQTLNKVTLRDALLATPGRLRRNHTTVDTGLDAIATWLSLVAADLALLAEETGMTTGDLDDRRRILL